jgi:Na+/H+-dicarboxylate symporter
MGRTAGLGVGGAGCIAFALLFIADQPALAYTALIVGLLGLSLASNVSVNWQILIAAGLGAAFGAAPGSGVELVGVVGRVFIALLKMLIAPMILVSITFGIAGMGGAAQLGRIGSRTLVLYLVTMALAVATGLLAVNLFEPGAGGALRETAFFASAVGDASVVTTDNLGPFLLKTVFQVLANPLASLAEGRVLPIVVFGILLGVALLGIGEQGRALVDVLRAAYAAIMYLISRFLRLAPVGIFALIGHLVATVGLGELVENLLAFAAVVVGATLFHAVVTLPAVAALVAGVGPLELFRGIREALLMAFSTSSSVATLPVTTRCVEENLEVPQSVSSFVLPLGATVNMDGTALYEAIAAIFIANVYGYDLSLGSQLVVFLVAMLTAVGAPGIPSAGMVTMIVVLESVGLPVEAIGILLAIDRFLDTFRTMVNVEGDAVVAVAVSRI